MITYPLGRLTEERHIRHYGISGGYGLKHFLATHEIFAAP